MIINILSITEDSINDIIPFNSKNKLTAKDKFDILMYQQKSNGSTRMFQKICDITGLDRLIKDESGYHYSISARDIHEAYDRIGLPLSYDDKLNILSQRVYEETYGLSVVDMLIMEDTSLDSISGGVSGLTTYNARFIEDEIKSETIRGLDL